MSAQKPTSLLTTGDLLAISNFRRERADALDAAASWLPYIDTLALPGSNLVRLNNDSGVSLIIGTPVYSDAGASVSQGIADGSGKSSLLGLVANTTVAAGSPADIAVAGVMAATTAQWDAICGTSGGLTFDAPYYLHPTIAGRLTATAPVGAGQEVVQVITALSSTEARIAITAPILI